MLNREEIDELVELGKSLQQVSAKIDALNNFGLKASNIGEVEIFELSIVIKNRLTNPDEISDTMITSMLFAREQITEMLGVRGLKSGFDYGNMEYKITDERFNYMPSETTTYKILQLIFSDLIKERRAIINKLQLLQNKTNG